MFIPPLRISLSGGGMRGLAHIGALEVLQERGLLKSVKEYLGISAGSFCAFAVCIGCTLSELRMVVALLDFGLMRSISPDDIFRFTETFGFDSGENMEKLITVLLRTKGLAPTITFAELAAHGKPTLRIFATDLNACLPTEFSAAKTPSVEVRQALRASMSIPVYFTPVKINAHLYVDGGVITHVPFHMIDYGDKATTLSLTFSDEHKPIAGDIPDIFAFLAQVYNSIYLYQTNERDSAWRENTVYLPCGKFPSTRFEATTEEKLGLMEAGRRGMQIFLESPRRPPPRRFSVA